ncbi:hypothetical protein EOD41_11385 [Mucilaginibacter limnophilus]|uniref:histidine kinase n=1 Tax=Mucilaginibacter limnophilus TaxID=1932778 RepID=A0A437MSJ8_9SPHI|nr:tetratricopeptide repeat-containing sensor histidine kinase [Mucilaginibacter limnophilus]RVU00597.1 hypothetical protein EOD41_11385 [Mucilaginibacter limnophilus]
MLHCRFVWLCCVLPIALSSCQKRHPIDNGQDSEEFKPILKQASWYFEHNQIDYGLVYLDSAFATLPRPTINDKFRYYGINFVIYNKVKGDHEKGLAFADSMLLYAKKSVNEKQYAANFAEANFARGDAFFDMNRFSDAYQCFYQGYLVGKNYVNNEALGDFTYRMAMIMYKQEHYNLAAGYFKESYAQNLAGTDGFVPFFRRQEILDNIGLCYKNNGQLDSALHYFDKTLSYLDEHGYKYPEKAFNVEMARGVVYGNMAEVLTKRGQYHKAATLLKKSIAINLQKDADYRDAQLTEIKLGKLYLDLNQRDSLKSLLELMKKQFDTLKNDQAEAEWNRLMASYFLKDKDYKKAAEYLLAYDEQKDTINKRLTGLRESDVTQQVANYENQHKIDTLRNNNKLQKIYLIAAVLITLMLIVIISLIFRNWKRSRNEVILVNKLNQQINQQNAILENALAELNISSREKDRILRAVAHDLRNPLGGIASLTTSLIDDDDFNDEQKVLLVLIKDTSYNSLELINEILEATNSYNANFKKEMVDINSLLSNSVELLRFKAAEKDQQITMELLKEPRELYISREKIWRVISNLISNATKFSPYGAIIHVKVTEEDDEVKIAVNDHGIGIPDHLKSEVFNMFTDAKRPGTAGEKSFGLGLSICKQIIDKHDGKIWFESNEHDGTTFFVKLQKQAA